MLADSPDSYHSSRLHMNPCNPSLMFISMHPAYKHSYSTCRWDAVVCYPPCLGAHMHLSSAKKICARSLLTHTQMLACRTHTDACMPSLPQSLSTSFVCNIHGAGGQRALSYHRSTSSNSKRHQSHPTHVLCITMRWRRQWKTIIDVGSVNVFSLAWQRSALKRWQPDEAVHCYCWLPTEAATEGPPGPVFVRKSDTCMLHFQLLVALFWHPLFPGSF